MLSQSCSIFKECEIHVLSEVSIVATPAGKPGFFLHAWRPRLGCFMPGSRARSLPPDSLEQVYAKPAWVFLQCVATPAGLFVCRGPGPAPCPQTPCNKMYLSVFSCSEQAKETAYSMFTACLQAVARVVRSQKAISWYGIAKQFDCQK